MITPRRRRHCHADFAMPPPTPIAAIVIVAAYLPRDDDAIIMPLRHAIIRHMLITLISLAISITLLITPLIAAMLLSLRYLRLRCHFLYADAAMSCHYCYFLPLLLILFRRRYHYSSDS